MSRLASDGSLEFKAKLQVYPSGSQVIGDGVLLLEDGLDPGAAGFVADLEEVKYLDTHPAVACHTEKALWPGLLPETAPQSERKADIDPVIRFIPIRIAIDDIIAFNAEGKSGAN